MKKILGLALAGIIAVGAAAVYAGEGCCAGAGADKTSAKAAVCADSLGKLNLTEKQKTAMAALQIQCKNAVSKSEAKQLFATGVERILTPEQLALWNEKSKEQTKAGGCPMLKSNAAGCAGKS